MDPVGSSANVNRIPREFNNNKNIKGVYIYINTLRLDDTWEEVAKRFCKEKLNVTLQGKGSTRAACKIIQENWGSFIHWSKQKRA